MADTANQFGDKYSNPVFDSIPAILRTINQWVLWKEEVRGDPPRKTKVPHTVSKQHAAVNDPRTWADFLTVAEAYEPGGWFDGVGIVLTRDAGVTGIDLDYHGRPGEVPVLDAEADLEPWARKIVDQIDSYSEVSPSGQGIHILARGLLPPGGRRKGQIEIYDSARFLTVTGYHVDGMPTTIEERQDEVTAFHSVVFGSQDERPQGEIGGQEPTNLSDEDVLRLGRLGRKRKKFVALYDRGDRTAHDGDDHSDSAADQALSNILAFYCGPGAHGQVDRLFRKSKLIRDKWDETRGDSTYGALTVAKAYEGRTRFYQPTKQDTGEDARLTDLGNATVFAQRDGGHVRYDHKRQRWLLFRGHRWRTDVDGEVTRLAIETVKARARAALDIRDRTDQTLAVKWALQSQNAGRLHAMLAIAKDLKPIADDGEDWDADPMLLCTPNGVVDLSTGERRDGRPEDRITLCTAVPYEPSAIGRRWPRFLEEVFETDADRIDYLQRAAGYSATGSHQEQVFFTSYGGGGNGKTTLMEALRGVLGEYAHDLAFTALTAGKLNTGLFDLADLPGKRFVTAAETEGKRTKLDEGRLKAMTGGDPMTASQKGKPQFSFQPTHKLWLCVNQLPKVDDDSNAFWQRARLIPFERTFRGRRGEVKGLADKLVRDEGAAILAWLVHGAVAWMRNGLGEPPQAVTRATESWRAESDDVAAFVGERCVVEDGRREYSSVLYKAYVAWATAQQRLPVTGNAFGRRLKLRFDGQHDRNGQYYVGVGLADTTHDVVDDVTDVTDVTEVSVSPQGDGLVGANGNIHHNPSQASHDRPRRNVITVDFSPLKRAGLLPESSN